MKCNINQSSTDHTVKNIAVRLIGYVSPLYPRPAGLCVTTGQRKDPDAAAGEEGALLMAAIGALEHFRDGNTRSLKVA